VTLNPKPYTLNPQPQTLNQALWMSETTLGCAGRGGRATITLTIKITSICILTIKGIFRKGWSPLVGDVRRGVPTGEEGVAQNLREGGGL
jgi:hypothetical protein